MLAGEILVDNDAYEVDLATGRITQLTKDINTVAIAGNSGRTVIAAQYVPLGDVVFREVIDGELKPLRGVGEVSGQAPEVSADGRILYVTGDPEEVRLIDGTTTKELFRMPAGRPDMSLGATMPGRGEQWLTVDQVHTADPPPWTSNLMLFEGKRLIERQPIPGDLNPTMIAWDGGDVAVIGRPASSVSAGWARTWNLRNRAWVGEILRGWQIVAPSPDFKLIMVSKGNVLGLIEPGRTEVTEVATLPWPIWEGNWVA